MALTEWNFRYELGIGVIDLHHKKLVELLNKTYDAILYSHDKNEVGFILSELFRYTDYHFKTEERIMKEIKYKRLKSHLANHNAFKKQLAVLKQSCISDAPYVSNDIVLFLWNWLKKHILIDDKLLAAALSPN